MLESNPVTWLTVSICILVCTFRCRLLPSFPRGYPPSHGENFLVARASRPLTNGITMYELSAKMLQEIAESLEKDALANHAKAEFLRLAAENLRDAAAILVAIATS